MGAEAQGPPSPAVDRRLDRWVAGLLAIGFIYRAWAVGHARFTGDESYFWATARNIATFEAAPVYGPSLTGSGAYHPGPLFFYLMALPQRLATSPWAGGLFVVLLHVLAGALTSSLARRAAGPRAGLLTLVLWLFAPWDVLYGDRIWLSCVAPVFGTALLYCATRLERAAAQGTLVFLVLVCPQLHMSAPIVWVAALVLVLLGPKIPWSKRALAAGLALAMFAYAPAIYWELTHDFTNTRAILNEGGGKEVWEKVRVTPLKVALYAWLYGTSEISYHFETGYWRPFDDLAFYGSALGWRSMVERQGLFQVGANVLSGLVALLGWGASLIALGASLRQWLRKVPRGPLPLEPRLLLALLSALAGAALLMMVSKKGYFPHYTNLLMPLLLVPVAFGLNRLWTSVLRGPLGVLVAVSVAAMLAGTTRYYLEVDRKNGLSATVEMVGQVMAGPMPAALAFDGFHNQFAWEMLANVAHRRQLQVDNGAPVRWRVQNGAIFRGAPPPGGTVHDGVLLVRSPEVSR